MAYDEGLAEQVRHLLEGAGGITERAMFGGLAFLADGRMAVAVGSDGEIMVRADGETEGRLLEQPGVEQTLMKGRLMRGWLDVDTSLLGGDGALAEVVAGAVAYARDLPPT